MIRVLVVAVAGACGAVARYGVGRAFGATGFPWATLTVNIVGSFVLGLLLGGVARRWHENLGLALTVGFLGAFTTFSTFSFEVTVMLRDGRGSTALAYVLVSLVAGVLVAAVGYSAASAFQ